MNPEPITRIEVPRRWPGLRTAELWHFRELLGFLVWKDLKIRYKQTLLGSLWAILQPLLTALVFTLVFGHMVGVGSDGAAYPLFSYTGLVVWTFFSQSVSIASSSLVSSSNIISKVYFPRSLIPVASVLANLVDFAVASFIVVVAIGAFGQPFTLRLLVVPAIGAMVTLTAIGVGLWLAALNVLYRDIRFVVPFLMQLWLFLSPVIYPISSVEPKLTAADIPTWILGINPMVGMVEGFRWAFLNLPTNPWPYIVVGCITSSLLVLSGTVFCRGVEKVIADVI